MSIPLPDLSSLYERLGYKFADAKLANLALTHRSSAKKTLATSPASKQNEPKNTAQNYERLEFLGDAVLSLVMAKYLYQRYPEKKEGQLTRMRATLVRQETLVVVAKFLRLGNHLTLGAGEIKAGGRGRESILADVVEALLGAIYLDCNDISTLERLVPIWFAQPLADIEKVDVTAELKDNKSQLQEWLQAQKLPLPQYSLEQISGKAPDEVFTVTCQVLDSKQQQTHAEQAQGKSRRIAEQNAAKLVLAQLQSKL